MSVRKSPLRAVGPDESPKPPRRLSLEEAAETGDPLEFARAQRWSMIAAVPDLGGPALAAMHRQLALISKEIAAMESKDADESEGGADVEDGEFDAEAI